MEIGEISVIVPVISLIVAKYIAPVTCPVCGLVMFLLDNPYIKESEVLKRNKSKYPVPFGLLIVAVFVSCPVDKSMDFSPLSPKKQKRLLYGFKAAPVRFMEDETEVCPIFVAIPVTGSIVAM
jgi:Na+-transporting methylmalonyl-CoA/oxaloacetate decarboxylase beta subunit